MDFVPEWQPVGGARCSRADGKRVASASPSPSRRNTEAPDATGAPAAGPSARARVRHSPLSCPWPPPPPRASGHDLDQQSIGPTAHGTHCPEVPVLCGGPESFAPATPRDLATGHSNAAARVGYRDQSSPRGLWCELRDTPAPAARLARRIASTRLSDGFADSDPSAPAGNGPSWLPARDLTAAAAELQVHSFVLAVRIRSRQPVWCPPGHLAR